MPRTAQNRSAWDQITAALLNLLNTDLDDLFANWSDRLRVRMAVSWTALRIDIWAGAFLIGSVRWSYAWWTDIVVTNAVTNYVMINSAWTIVISTSAFDDNNARLATVVCAWWVITSITDYRVNARGGQPGADLTWSTITAATKQMVNGEAYVADRTTLITFTLPATAAVGEKIAISWKGIGWRKIAQNASQYIAYSSRKSTTWTGWFLQSLEYQDSVTLECVEANVKRQIVSVNWSPTFDTRALLDDVYQYHIFGDWSDGDVTISWNTTLARDMYYNNLTINAGIVLSPDWYKIYVRWTLLNNGTIRRNWNAGAQWVWNTAGGLGGAALNAWTLWDSVAGGDGWNTTNASAPTAGTAGTAANPSYSNVNGSAGGAGGAGDQAGGAAGAAWTTTRWSLYNVVYSIYDVFMNWANPASSVNAWFFGAGTLYKWSASSGWGWGGDRNGAADGGAWGGGWSAGGVIWIAARILNNAGVIESIWWAGGAWRNSWWSNGGGWGWGWGGAGGVIYLIYKTLTALGTCTVTGGAFGAKGTKTWTGVDGADGTVWSTWVTIQIAV